MRWLIRCFDCNYWTDTLPNGECEHCWSIAVVAWGDVEL